MFRAEVQPDLTDSLVVRPDPSGRTPRGLPVRCDVAVLGGDMAGLATALRLQAARLSTVVFEAHGHAGGCAARSGSSDGNLRTDALYQEEYRR
ncbi:MAG: hypothetical protein AUI14_23345 [Actinobacteria bacterium 13_2_20CM_2_71_6]|nr:MAG: hypothetical protein AUI14_23345 [Actinobacteria bacterium 13_2_20CM_2_71_6]